MESNYQNIFIAWLRLNNLRNAKQRLFKYFYFFPKTHWFFISKTIKEKKSLARRITLSERDILHKKLIHSWKFFQVSFSLSFCFFYNFFVLLISNFLWFFFTLYEIPNAYPLLIYYLFLVFSLFFNFYFLSCFLNCFFKWNFTFLLLLSCKMTLRLKIYSCIFDLFYTSI